MTDLLLSAKGKLSGSASSEDYNRSTVKRLFSSVFSIIDSDQEISHFEDHEQSSPVDRLLQNSNFLAHLQDKLQAEGFYQAYKIPILRLLLEEQSNRYEQRRYASSAISCVQLDEDDIRVLASRFGHVHKVILTTDKRQAYLFFSQMTNAFICHKILQNIKLRAGNIHLNIEWVHHTGYHHQIANQIHKFVLSHNAGPPKEQRSTDLIQDSAIYATKQNKFTCRYDIQIENQREFQVARRIIGPKGCNMKRIIEESVSAELKASDSLNELLKLRLRGKGSGYKEGPQQQESNESLHLCVSAKDENVYNQACLKVQKLLGTIYIQYAEFMRKQGKSADLTIKKILLGPNSSSTEQTCSSYGLNNVYRRDYEPLIEGESTEDLYRISPQKIGELLEMRNKARRELNFNEADRIRNYLRSLGVCLIDEKGRRGKAAEVTTWKYIY